VTAYTGADIDRVDGAAKVTGRATYAAEFDVAEFAYAVLVTSPVGVGRVTSVDDGEARAVKGVLAILSSRHGPKIPAPHALEDRSPAGRVLQLFQEDKILYNDHPVAVVVAETWEAAEEAAGKLKVTCDATGPLRLDMAAKETMYAPKKVQDGPPDYHRGNFDAAFTNAPVKLDLAYETPWQSHNPMEPHATLAVWHAPDALTVYDATQGIFGVQKRLAALFDLPPSGVRVLSPYVGGGFGCKGTPWSHVALAALAAKHVERPVRLVLKRSQMFSLVGHRPATQQRIRIAAAPDGKLTALSHDVLTHTSSFDEFIEPCSKVTRMLYACPNLRTTQRLVRLDIPTPTFMRAPGEATGTFALECAMDELAVALRIDPVELRLENHADGDPEKNVPWSSKSLRACYEAGTARFGWSKRPKVPRAMREGHLLIGWGMATSTYPARRDKASAVATVRQDGSALVQAGTQDIGTGTYTIMSQIAADALGLPLEHVTFELGDTRLPATPVSGGSRTAATVGSAVKEAGGKLRQALMALASATEGSPLQGAALAGLEVERGRVQDKTRPERGITYAALLKLAKKNEVRAEAEAAPDPKTKDAFSSHSFGAQFVEVAVDEDLGEVRVRRMVGAFAVGQVLNAKTARSQLQGGMVWGIGFALHEHTAVDPRNGRVMTRDLADYHVPVHTDVPDIEVVFVPEEDTHVNPVGAKGIGEIGITGAAAAIANAVYHATGQRIRSLPITPDKLL
jgi:xanthine dehydrogenase YagR molybdenum-binding subunit